MIRLKATPDGTPRTPYGNFEIQVPNDDEQWTDGWIDGWVDLICLETWKEIKRSNKILAALRAVFEFQNDVVMMFLVGNCVQRDVRKNPYRLPFHPPSTHCRGSQVFAP